MAKPTPDNKPARHHRRTYIRAITGFCMLVIVYVLWKGEDTSLANSALTMAFGTLGTCFAAYVTGRAFEHKHENTIAD